MPTNLKLGLQKIATKGKENSSEILYTTIGTLIPAAIGFLGLTHGIVKDIPEQIGLLITTIGLIITGGVFGFTLAKIRKSYPKELNKSIL